jgi:PadR family transcriptional regulator PadR
MPSRKESSRSRATRSRSSRDPFIPRHRLEYKKLLSSRWKPSETGREAKFYELTSKGRTHLKVETENWTRLTDVVSLILEGTVEGI